MLTNEVAIGLYGSVGFKKCIDIIAYSKDNKEKEHLQAYESIQ
jgi:ribosomal protein S18 acetylase RimI-like enzyme